MQMHSVYAFFGISRLPFFVFWMKIIMKVKPIVNGAVISVSKDAVLPHLSTCNDGYLKVLLYVLANPEFDENEICDYLDITKKKLKSALTYWTEKGVIESGESVSEIKVHKVLNRSNELPKYSADDIADFCENNPRFQSLLQNCQQIYGKMFNMAEIEILICLVDYLKLDDDYIILLFTHCKKMEKTSLRYIEKLAVGLYDEGVLAYDELDAYLNMLEESHKIESQIKKIFGFGHRKLTTKESKFVETWVGVYHYSIDVIEKAYEITVENTGTASMPYCNAVLQDWHEKGYETSEQIDAALELYKQDKEEAKDKKGSFETDDFFEAAIRKIKESNS